MMKRKKYWSILLLFAFTGLQCILAQEKQDTISSEDIDRVIEEAIAEGEKWELAGDSCLIDWNEFREVMSKAREEARQAMDEIDWDEIRAESEDAAQEVKKAWDEIDWEALRMEIEKTGRQLDSLLKDLDFNFDPE